MPKELKKSPEQVLPEVPRPPETAVEKSIEATSEQSVEIQSEKQPVAAEITPPVAPAVVTPSTAQMKKDPETAAIENILAEGLEETYRTLSPELQIKFKVKGEETAGKIQKLIQTAKAKAKTILGLIRDWLKLIPGVNKFFLEQEAKIKTDKILARVEQQKNKKI